MNKNALKLLIELDGVHCLGEECAAKTLSLLSDPDVRMVDGAPTQEYVSQLLPTLKARLSNTTHTGKRIFGLKKTIERLTSMNGTDRIIGYGFISPRNAGNIYLDNENESMLGATVVDR